MQKESDYLVSNQKLIVEHLTDLFKHKCIITAYFGENNTSFLTAILELDAKNNRLIIDCAPTELLNRQLLNSAKVLFRSQIEGIKVSFSGKNIKKIKSGDSPAFEMPIPSAIFWMQRRQFYRVKIPLAHIGTHCKITFNLDQNESTAELPLFKTGTFRLADLSINGFALLNPEPEFSEFFETGKAFGDCLLCLHEGPQSNISFTIQSVIVIRVSTTATQQRIGCKLTGLSTTFESGIQRYMQDIERQIKNIG
jgi:flagellar brake protein